MFELSIMERCEPLWRQKCLNSICFKVPFTSVQFHTTSITPHVKTSVASVLGRNANVCTYKFCGRSSISSYFLLQKLRVVENFHNFGFVKLESKLKLNNSAVLLILKKSNKASLFIRIGISAFKLNLKCICYFST